MFQILVSDTETPSGEGAGFRCLPGYWKCSSQNICIKNTWTCDGYNDCHDKSDESDVLCSEYYSIFQNNYKSFFKMTSVR